MTWSWHVVDVPSGAARRLDGNSDIEGSIILVTTVQQTRPSYEWSDSACFNGYSGYSQISGTVCQQTRLITLEKLRPPKRQNLNGRLNPVASQNNPWRWHDVTWRFLKCEAPVRTSQPKAIYSHLWPCVSFTAKVFPFQGSGTCSQTCHEMWLWLVWLWLQPSLEQIDWRHKQQWKLWKLCSVLFCTDSRKFWQIYSLIPSFRLNVCIQNPAGNFWTGCLVGQALQAL